MTASEELILERIAELKTMLSANTRHTLAVSMAVSELADEVRVVREVVESEAPTVPDNPIPLLRVSDTPK